MGINIGMWLNIGNSQHNSLLSYLQKLFSYKTRVEADSGEVQDTDIVRQIYKHLQDNKTYDTTKLIFTPEAGIKIRESGVYDFITKGYDMAAGDGVNQDPVQTTEADQPYVSGNIAPTEKKTVKNPNGDRRYLTHPAISFASDEAWSVTTVFNFLGNSDEGNSIYGGNVTSRVAWYVNFSFPYLPYFQNVSGGGTYFSYEIKEYIGKNVILTLVADGNGSLSWYLNGTFKETLNVDTAFKFYWFLAGRRTSYCIPASAYYHRVQSGAMTPTQALAEATFLRTLYPEIETVEIGDQEWATSNCEMVATPIGNVIAEMQTASAVEKITGGDFEGGLVGTLTSGDETSTWTENTTNPISGSKDGLLEVTAAGTEISRPYIKSNVNDTTINKWYRVSFDYKVNSGTCVFRAIHLGSGAKVYASIISGSGTITKYIKSAAANDFIGTLYFDGRNTFSVQIDNWSVQELGWADSQDLYDDLINNQGYTEQEALQECAWWCYYNNDSALGSVYGKLYNWFAAKLLQNDIDTYNAANPDAHWGYHVPTEAEFITLQTALGGESVAGGKMKVAGTDYWSLPNTGADNSSGFTALPSGRRRHDNGDFQDKYEKGNFWAIDLDASGYPNLAFCSYDGAAFSLSYSYKQIGFSLHLIKDS